MPYAATNNKAVGTTLTPFFQVWTSLRCDSSIRILDRKYNFGYYRVFEMI